MSGASKMVLFVLLPRVRHFHGQALALVTTAPSLLRQVRSRRYLTILSSLKQKHSQLDSKDRIQSPQKPELLERIKPETLQRTDNAGFGQGQTKDSLLAEQSVSNKEQRKADWAIMKEMSRYLWPKVG